MVFYQLCELEYVKHCFGEAKEVIKEYSGGWEMPEKNVPLRPGDTG